MIDLKWPPRTAREMKAWQNEYGSDNAIALYLGRTPGSVSNVRQSWNVPTIKRGKIKPVYEKKPEDTLSEEAIFARYAGRRYQDVRFKVRG